MKNLKFILLLFVSSIIMTGVNATVSNVAPSESKGNIVFVNSTKPDFTITMPRNATTGYSWILKNPEVYTFVEQISYKYELGDRKLIGSGGQDIWQFRVRKEYFKAPVTFQLHFIYAQPWELMIGQEKVFNIVTMPSE
jgi:predicted secreted protein